MVKMKNKEQIESDKRILEYVDRLKNKSITEWTKDEINAMAVIMAEVELRSMHICVGDLNTLKKHYGKEI